MDTPSISIINLAIIGSALAFMLCMLYVGLHTAWQAYASGPSWRNIANNLERECECLHRQNKALELRLKKVKHELQYHLERTRK